MEDFESVQGFKVRMAYFSYGITFFAKKKNQFPAVLDKNFDTFIGISKKWLKDQDLGSAWTVTHAVISNDDEPTELTIKGKKHFLDISDAGLVTRGERFNPDSECHIVSFA